MKNEKKNLYFWIERTKCENFENFENHEYDKKTKKKSIELLIDDRNSSIINFIENNVKLYLIRTTFYIINLNNQNIFSI